MGSVTASVRLDAPTCPVQQNLPPGCTLHHISPGVPGPPFGFGEGNFPQGWFALATTAQGTLLEAKTLDCRDCVLAKLPAGVRPLRASVSRTGIEAELIAPSPEDLFEALEVLRSSGIRVQVLRTGSRPKLDWTSGVFVNLGHLTGRQLETVRTAVQLGYFDPRRGSSILDVAERIGCTGPTAHEHLRKAVSKIMDGLFKLDGVDAGLAAEPLQIRQGVYQKLATTPQNAASPSVD